MGTLRENLYVDSAPQLVDSLLLKSVFRDPQNTRTDAEIISALQRAWLLPRDGPVDAVTEAKFSLNASVSDEGDKQVFSTRGVPLSRIRFQLQRRRKAATGVMPGTDQV